jgi:hypothetical protein
VTARFQLNLPSQCSPNRHGDVNARAEAQGQPILEERPAELVRRLNEWFGSSLQSSSVNALLQECWRAFFPGSGPLKRNVNLALAAGEALSGGSG